MAQEIDRARGLLSALIRDKVMAADEATKAYEAWVASGDEAPFCRFVVELFPQRGEGVREVLRAEVVRGMPRPGFHTYERFEDLLVGQLGIEAGMLSPKLLQTVRAVQDKKLAEGKLRRLEELLPRAGFDDKMVRMLYQHLRERVLLCKGCLGRFPRKEMGSFAVECPRCDYNMLADALEPSDVKMLPEEQRMALMASSEAVLETVSIADRQRTRRDRGSPQSAKGLVFGLVGVLGVIVVVIGVLLMRESANDKRKTVKRRTKTKKTYKTEKTDDTPKTGLTLTEVREQDQALYTAGKFEELIELWKKVEVQSGQAPEEIEVAREGRLRRLSQVSTLAKQVLALEGQVSDMAKEQELARLLGSQDVPVNVPPFNRVAKVMGQLLAARNKKVQAAAQDRFDKARVSATKDVWLRLRKAGRASRALMGVTLDGQLVNGLKLLDLDSEGFEIQTPTGTARRFQWDDEPDLSLRVIQAAASEEATDQAEVLRRALIARNPLVASEALGRVPGSISLTTLLSKAPTSVVPTKLGEGLYRVNYPTRWRPSDMEPGRGSRLTSEGGVLILTGKPCRMQSRAVPALAPDRKVKTSLVFAEIQLKEAVPGLFFGLRLVSKGAEKSYVARWGGGQWSLELSLGSGRGGNKLRSGQLRSAGREARITYDGREVTLVLDGFPVFTKSTTARMDGAGFVLGASQKVEISSVRVEGTLEPSRLAGLERRFRDRINRNVDTLSVQIASGGEKFGFPALSVEDPQILAALDPARIEELSGIKKQVVGGQLKDAADALDALLEKTPRYAAAQYVRAYVALQRGMLSRALLAVNVALDVDAGFAEARALRGLVLAKAARFEDAEADLERALRVRPDLALGYVAKARLALARADLSEAPSGPLAAEDLRLAQGLGRGDPIVARETRALIALERLARQLNTRFEGEGHLLLSRGELAPIEGLAQFYDHTLLRVLKTDLRLPKNGGSVRVALVPEQYSRLTQGAEAKATYLPLLNLVVLAEPIQEPTPALLRALVRGHLALRMGAAPPWLTIGTTEQLIRRVNRKFKDKVLIKALTQSLRVKPEEWTRTLTTNTAGLLSDDLLRARTWALVEGVLNNGQRKKGREAASEGRPVTAEVMGLDVSKIDTKFKNFVRRVR
jgi:tetratricopeptide (TPR) repeat protein